MHSALPLESNKYYPLRLPQTGFPQIKRYKTLRYRSSTQRQDEANENRFVGTWIVIPKKEK
jgi:hypothetical protein